MGFGWVENWWGPKTVHSTKKQNQTSGTHVVYYLPKNTAPENLSHHAQRRLHVKKVSKPKVS